MSYVPILKAKDIVSILLKAGFRVVRQKGSHIRLKHILDATKNVSVPVHNKDVPIRILKSILNQAKIPLEEFIKLLGRR